MFDDVDQIKNYINEQLYNINQLFLFENFHIEALKKEYETVLSALIVQKILSKYVIDVNKNFIYVDVWVSHKYNMVGKPLQLVLNIS